MDKRGKIAAGIAGGIFLLCLLVPAGAVIRPETDSVITIYGDPPSAVPAAKAMMFGVDVSDKVAVEDGTDYSRVGNYHIAYRYSLLGIPMRTVRIPSVVADMDAPVIDMEDGAVVFVKAGADRPFPAYKIRDNYDAPEDIEVTLNDEGEAAENGITPVQLKACDTSGNCTVCTVSIIAGDAEEKDFLPENFDLETLDTSHYLLEPGAEPGPDYMFRETYWIGDSNILNLGKYGGVSADRIIARYAMGPATFDLPIHYGNVQQTYSTIDLVKRINPKRVVLMMGEAESGSGNPLKLAEEYGKCLDELKAASPSTEIIVSAILPIRKGSTEAAASQEQINRVNYCLLQMCREKKIPMLCADHWLKDESGYGIPEYYLDDGFHLQAASFPAYTDYVRYCLKPKS